MAEKPIGVGLIGANLAGSWGVMAHLPAIAASRRFLAVAVATSHAESARATADRFDVAKAFDDPGALIADPDVDLVTICVRVPHHRALVEAALRAGKHVYCEWPLAVNADEAADLVALAAETRRVAAVGLQARAIPALVHARDLIEAGEIGEVIGASLDHSGSWPTALPASMSYLQDRATGATFLTICGGHALDALCHLAGDFSYLAAVAKTMTPAVEEIDSGRTITRTSPDQVAIAGILAGGGVATARLHGGSGPGTGFRLEVNGRKGNLLLTAPAGTFGFQMGDLDLFRTDSAEAGLRAIDVPQSCRRAPDGTPPGPPQGVGEIYARLADAIDHGAPAPADFTDALRLHRLIGRIDSEDSRPRQV